MQPDFFICPGVRSLPSPEGTILLDLRSGKYFALNPTASLVWSRLELKARRDEIERALRETFGAGEEVGADLEALLVGLEGRGLITAEPPPGPSPPAPLPPPLSPSQGEEGRGGEGPGGRHILTAFAALVFVDLTVLLLGFPRCSRLLAWTARAGRPANPGRIERICRAVDVAARFYFKRAWCLQRSLAAVLLLRLAGQPAELVIGVRRLPFLAHAWVEVEGCVVNDDPRVKPTFPEMARC